jgi:succinate dehydrogenase / fumarate reductase iron-sulfur subunit
MLAQLQDEAFGACTNYGECEAVCPKNIKIENIARLNRDYLKAALTYREETSGGGAG